MKKIFLSALLLLGALCTFTACDDDNDSNPTLVQPTTFVLNEPAYSGEVIDLANSTHLSLTWSQPNYGFPVVAKYYLQLSVTGNFTTSVAEAQADESGKLVADYVSAEDGATLCARDFASADVAKMLQQLCKWKEEAVPETQEVYARIYANIPVSGGAVPSVGGIASNVVKINVAPYYVELKDALPELWYLIGDAIGDGKWTNDPDAIGTSVIPMNVQKNGTYDKKDGKGVIEYTGYFEAGKGFKLVKTPGAWEEQWGSGADGFVKNDGGSGNINVPADGYYTVSLDTKEDILTVEEVEAPAKTFDVMYMAGVYGNWDNPIEMKAVNQNVAKNHVWSYLLDATAGPTECKFMQLGWADNWGSISFPYGVGTNGGKNIPVEEGKYMVVFNDITGAYNFIAK